MRLFIVAIIAAVALGGLFQTDAGAQSNISPIVTPTPEPFVSPIGTPYPTAIRLTRFAAK